MGFGNAFYNDCLLFSILIRVKCSSFISLNRTTIWNFDVWIGYQGESPRTYDASPCSTGRSVTNLTHSYHSHIHASNVYSHTQINLVGRDQVSQKKAKSYSPLMPRSWSLRTLLQITAWKKASLYFKDPSGKSPYKDISMTRWRQHGVGVKTQCE